MHGDIRLSSITTKLIKALLDTYIDQGKNRLAQSVRSAYTDLFIEAAQCGEIDSNFNPAKNTRKPKARVNKSRLSLEQFELICANQKYCSHKLTYLLALVTGQRRTDISLMRKNKGNDWESRFEAYRQNYSYFMDKEGGYASFSQLVEYVPYSFIEKDYLHVFQLKTGKLLKIPLELKLKKFNVSIQDVITQADRIQDSEFIVHHTTARACNALGDPLHPDTVSRSFKRAREAAKIEWQATPATFHEIR